MTTVDIVGIGDHQMEYPDANLDNFEPDCKQYLTIASKIISHFADRFRPGLSSEMLSSDDAVSNVATSVMLADWRWTPDYRSKDGKVRSKRAYRNQCGIWAIYAYIERRANSKNVQSLDRILSRSGGDGDDITLYGLVADEDAFSPVELAIREESIAKVNAILDSAILTDQQREFIRLKYLNGCTLQEIADDNGCTREAVRQVLQRGINQIRKVKGSL